jgi:hypothetical protein
MGVDGANFAANDTQAVTATNQVYDSAARFENLTFSAQQGVGAHALVGFSVVDQMQDQKGAGYRGPVMLGLQPRDVTQVRVSNRAELEQALVNNPSGDLVIVMDGLSENFDG